MPLKSAAMPWVACTRRQALMGAAYAVLVGCATPNAQEHGELVSPIAPPKDLNDLMRRIKDGLVNNVFLQPGFATEPNLLHFFGAREISWREKAPSPFGSLGDFGSSIASMPGRHDPFGLTIHFAFNRREETLPNAFLELVFGQTVRRVRYSELVNLFGRAWKPVKDRPPEMPNPHRVFLPTTDPHGNERVDLDLSDASFLRSVQLEFDEHGTVWLMNVNTLRK